MSDSSHIGGNLNNRAFATTRWSIVRAANDSDPAVSKTALHELCELYWYPLYSFVRRQGEDANTAADFTQSFFADLLEREDLKRVDPQLGRFRSFLLAALKNFIRNQWKKDKTLKRGGGANAISLDFAKADEMYSGLAVETETPEQIFDRQWALTLIQRANSRLKSEFESRGKGFVFDNLKAFLSGKNEESTIASAAQKLQMSEVAAKVAIHRMRVRFGLILREEISSTVENNDEVEQEIQHLFAVLKG